MVGYYRLKDVGFRLAAGAHLLPRATFAPVEETAQLLADAEAKAAEIVAQAREAFEQEKQRGYQEGQAKAQLESIERLMAEQQVLDRGLAGIERDLARLVTDCVRRIIEGYDETARTEGIVRGALKQMRQEKRVELRVPPRLHALIRGRIDAIKSEFPEIDLIDLVEDGALEPTQIIVETSIGRVDGHLSQRLDELEDVIRGAIAQAATADAEAGAAPAAAVP